MLLRNGTKVRLLEQRKPSIKDTPNQGNLSNEDSVCCPNHIEQLCAHPPLN